MLAQVLPDDVVPLLGTLAMFFAAWMLCALSITNTPTPPQPHSPVTARRLTRKPRPAWLLARGREPLPACVHVDEHAWSKPTLLKHDAFAATALYSAANDPTRQLIVKFARTSSAFGVPFAWLGRLSAQREQRVHQRLLGLVGIPVAYDTVADAHHRPIRNAWARQFIPATTLDQTSHTQSIPDTFFPALRQLVAQAHTRGVAFVDLNKPDNLLILPDGSAGIIDFQISTTLHEAFPHCNPISRAWLALLQDCDRYHLMKHWARRRPDQLTEAERDLNQYRPAIIRFWRRTWRPVILLRRRLLVLLRVRHGKGTADTETTLIQPSSQRTENTTP